MIAACLFLVATQAVAEAKPTTLVIPFEVGPGLDPWIAEYAADALPRTLSVAGSPAVQRVDRLQAHAALDLPSTPVSRATAVRLAEAFGASRVVVGRAEAQGAEVRFEARILDVGRAALSAPFTARGPLEQLSDVVFGLGWDIALSGESPPSTSRAAVSASRPRVYLGALRAYGEALAARETRERERLLKAALAEAPAFDDARLTLARLQIEAREYSAAETTLASISPESPLRREADFLRGVVLLGLRRYAEAARIYEPRLSEAPTPATLTNRALAILRGGEDTKVRASDLLREASEKLPGSAEITFDLALALLVEGDAAASVFWLQGLKDLDPRDNHTRLLLSWALRSAGRLAEADAEWKDLTARSSGFSALQAPDLTRRLERVLLSEHPFVMDPSRRADAIAAAGHRGRGEQALAAGEIETAFRELSRAAYLNPYEARVHRALARLHRSRGEGDKATAELRMSLWCAEDLAVRIDLMDLLQSLGRGQEARAEAVRILKADPTNPSALKLVAEK